MKTRLFCTLAASLSLFQLASAQEYTWNEATSNGYNYRYVSGDPTQTRFYTLKNGLTVILTVNTAEPRLQTIIATRGGSKNDPADNTGLAHYLEHMLFKGTDKYGTLDWEKEKPLLDKVDSLYNVYNQTTDAVRRTMIYHEIDSVSGLAAQFSIANEYDKMMTTIGAKGTNAFTWYEETAYINDIPNNQLETWLDIEAERFRNPILRLFHTELEAVYEEKNISMDDEWTRVSDSLYAGLFQKHNYGLQTTIGTVDHLKNPSLKEIRKFYETYYVPNNMCVIMAGDFNPDQVIALINQKFSYMTAQQVPAYTYQEESPITAPIEKTVTGPESPFIEIGYRFPGAHSDDAEMLELIGEILYNGDAGLFDLNLVKNQEVLYADAFASVMKDYSILELSGEPKTGQSLETVRDLMLAEIEKLKTGDFDENILVSIQNNYKKYLMQQQESNPGRAYTLLDVFIKDVDFAKEVSKMERLTKVTKQNVIDFANKWFSNNYVVVYKKKGSLPKAEKVEKPSITPVEVNRDKQSDFVAEITGRQVKELTPQFLDFTKDMSQSTLGNVPVYSVQNTNNDLFTLYYLIDFGVNHDKRVEPALDYLYYLGTETMSADEVSKQFYSLACSYNVSTWGEFTYVSISGLNENLDKALQLIEELITKPKGDESALKETINMTLQERKNYKTYPYMISYALGDYAEYGPVNPFTYSLSNQELKKLKSDELISLIKSLGTYSHKVLYYGPDSPDELTQKLSQYHKVPETFATAPSPKVFMPQSPEATTVYFADYNKVQTEIGWTRPVADYNPDMVPMASIFNEYFGGGMSSIVFQEIRESKALAYSSYSVMTTPWKKELPFSMLAYVGCQADKMKDAIQAMNSLLDSLPLSETNMEACVKSLRNNISSSRIRKQNILFTYLTAERQGIGYDIRSRTYEKVANATLEEINAFHQQYVTRQPFNIYITGSKKKVDMKYLASLGKVEQLSLKQIFGY